MPSFKGNKASIAFAGAARVTCLARRREACRKRAPLGVPFAFIFMPLSKIEKLCIFSSSARSLDGDADYLGS